MTAQRTAGSVLRQTLAALIILPLAFVLIAFAVANRQFVTLSLDPFGGEPPAAQVTLPLFALVIGLVVLGVVIGGVAAWFGQGRWRRLARRLEREAADLKRQIDEHRRAAGAPPSLPELPRPPERLELRPPGS